MTDSNDVESENEFPIFKPVRIISFIANILWFLIGLFIFVAVCGFIAYIISCFLDRRMPTTVYEYKASDTYLGSKIHVHLVGHRTRQCEITLYRYATDVKGNTVYEGTIDRPTNGEINKNITLDDDLQLNHKAKPGTATMYQYFQWKCPYNIIHKYIQPLELQITDKFEIYATKEDYDRAQENASEGK